jgi:hypothetical protein
MNKLAIAIISVTLTFGPASWAAQNDDHAAHDPENAQGQEAAPQSGAQGAAQMQEMQTRMKEMQELMSRMHSTNDRREMAKLMN